MEIGDCISYPLETKLVFNMFQISEETHKILAEKFVKKNHSMNKSLHVISAGEDFFTGIYQHDEFFYICKLEV